MLSGWLARAWAEVEGVVCGCPTTTTTLGLML